VIYVIAELIPEWERTNMIQKWLDDVERFFSELLYRR